jgi:PilZ domain
MPRIERRKNFRVTWNLPATIYDVKRHLERPCILSDLSGGGARLSGVRANTVSDEFRLRTPLGDRHSCHVVVWRTDNELGVRFTDRNEKDFSRKETEVANP